MNKFKENRLQKEAMSEDVKMLKTNISFPQLENQFLMLFSTIFFYKTDNNFSAKHFFQKNISISKEFHFVGRSKRS